MRKMMYINHVIGQRDGDALSFRLSSNSFLTSHSEWKQWSGEAELLFTMAGLLWVAEADCHPRQSRKLWMKIHSKDRCERVLLLTFFIPEGKQKFGTTCRCCPRLCGLLEGFLAPDAVADDTECH